MPDPPADGLAGLADLVAKVDQHLLDGERQFTRHDVAEQSGLSLDEARTLWRALGFAAVDDDSRVFAAADIAALRNVAKFKELAGIDDDGLHAMTRIIGQTFARLASWQGQITLEMVAREPELLTANGGDGVIELMEQLTPMVGELHEYVWRRQLAAYFARVASGAIADQRADQRAESKMAVGFADLADFTAFTRHSSEHDLRRVLGTFETLATDIVGSNQGQIVKTIGDEVLFVADDPGSAAEIALALVEAAGGDLPQLRAGVAFGDVVSRLGDVYGQTVNIASRLTSLARTGSVLVDEGMSAALRESPRYALRSLRPVSVRGYHHLRAHRLRRAES